MSKLIEEADLQLVKVTKNFHVYELQGETLGKIYIPKDSVESDTTNLKLELKYY